MNDIEEFWFTQRVDDYVIRRNRADYMAAIKEHGERELLRTVARQGYEPISHIEWDEQYDPNSCATRFRARVRARLALEA